MIWTVFSSLVYSPSSAKHDPSDLSSEVSAAHILRYPEKNLCRKSLKRQHSHLTAVRLGDNEYLRSMMVSYGLSTIFRLELTWVDKQRKHIGGMCSGTGLHPRIVETFVASVALFTAIDQEHQSCRYCY